MIHKKTPAPESFFNQVTSMQACNFLKMRPWYRWFLVNFAKSLRTSFFSRYTDADWFLTSHENNMPKISHHNTLYILRCAHVIFWTKLLENFLLARYLENFLLARYLENFLLARYLIAVAAAFSFRPAIFTR